MLENISLFMLTLGIIDICPAVFVVFPWTETLVDCSALMKSSSVLRMLPSAGRHPGLWGVPYKSSEKEPHLLKEFHEISFNRLVGVNKISLALHELKLETLEQLKFLTLKMIILPSRSSLL